MYKTHFQILIVFIVFNFISLSSAFAQNKYEYLPGKVIDLKGDTSDYLILFEDKFRNPDVILYRKKESDEGKYFAPEEVKGFEIEDREFVSTIADLEISPYKSSELNSNGGLKIIKDTIFLQKLISGDKTLLFHRSLSGKVNFYIDDNGDYVLLKHKLFLKKTRVVENKEYSIQLIKYLEDCPDLIEKIQSTKYEQSDLVKLFKKYFQCKNAKPAYNFEQKKIIPKFNLYTGMTSTNLRFTSNSAAVFHLTKGDFESSINFTGGIGMGLILPLNKYRFSLNTELLYTSYNIKGNYVNEIYTGYTIENNTSFEFSQVAFNYMLRYSIPLEKAIVFANAGYFINFNINESDAHIEDVSVSGNISTREGYTFGEDGLRMHEKGPSLGIGVRYNKFSLELRGAISKDIITYIAIGGYTKRFTFLAGYQF